MPIYIPFTYRVGWSSINKHYYGVRYAKGCSPSDLWTRYFTSSKMVKKFRQQYGDPDIIEVRRTFSDSESARLWEQKVLHKLGAAQSENWLNEHNSDNKFYNKGYLPSKDTIEKRRKSNTGKKRSEETKRKIGESNSVKCRTPELRQRISDKLKGRKLSPETVAKRELTKDLKGRPKPNLGKAIPDDIRAKISQSLKGRKRPPEVIARIKSSIARRKNPS